MESLRHVSPNRREFQIVEILSHSESERLYSKFFVNIKIALIHAFLTNANIYIIQPALNGYLSSIGSYSFYAGYMLELTHIGCLLSTCLYSYWSNQNLKIPLYFSIGILLVANLFNAFSIIVELDYVRFTLIGISRLLIGIGDAKVIDLRILIDYTTKRTLVRNILLFVLASSLGSAIGRLF